VPPRRLHVGSDWQAGVAKCCSARGRSETVEPMLRSHLRLRDAQGAECPSASCKGERDPDADCREPANDRGEPYDFTSFIED